MKNKCLLSFLAIVFIFSNAFADRIHSYPGLVEAMRAGDYFVVLIDMQECTGNPNMPVGYFTPSKMLLIPSVGGNPERIVTSDLHFTDYSGSPTYEYTKYTFKPDNTVAIRTTLYDPLTFKVIGKEYEINCTLDNGLELHATSLNSGQ